MPTRTATATWKGTLTEGQGTMALPDGQYEGPYTRASRFADGEGTNPEELLGAAHAGCYSMFLSGLLSKAGYEPTSIDTTARVTIDQVDGAPTITTIALETEAEVPGLEGDELRKHAEDAKAQCPVSKALAAVSDITVDARLVS